VFFFYFLVKKCNLFERKNSVKKRAFLMQKLNMQ